MDHSIAVIETQIAVLMRRAEAALRTLPVAEGLGLDRAAYLILRHLDEAGPLNISALADALHLDGSTVTRQVTALAKAGLATRERDPRDGRGAVVARTPAGRARMLAVRSAREQQFAWVLGQWSANDRHLLATLLHRLNQSVQTFALGRRPWQGPPDGSSARRVGQPTQVRGVVDGMHRRPSIRP